MISLIICSRSSIIDQALLNNIEKTIGLTYEIISIDNSTNKYGICAAYNLGVEKSKYPILCFMHDDIQYQTNDWGIAVLNHFNNKDTGAIGIAGTPFYSFMPGPWWGSGVFYEHLLQSSKTNADPVLKSNITEPKQVVAIDGVWFCIKKTLFNQLKFDEVNFGSFHFYDTDICMQMHNLGIKMYCVPDILIHHISMGALNDTWIENDLTFQKKWRSKLPAKCVNIGYNQQLRFEYKTLNEFILICWANNWANKKIYRLALKYLFLYKKGYLFYKMPGYFIKFSFKMLFKKGAPFYTV